MKFIIQQLFEYQKKNLFLRLISDLVYLIFLLMIIWLSTFIADAVFHFSEAVRWVLLIFNLSLSLYIIWQFSLKTISALIRLKPDDDFSDVADHIGRNYPDIADRLKNVYQLIKYETIGSSENLKAEAINNFSEKYAAVKFKNSLHLKRYLPAIHVLIIVLCGSLFMIFGLRQELSLSAKRVFNPPNTYERIPPYLFSVSPGTTVLMLGRNLDVTALYQGPRADNCVLEYKSGNDPYYRQIPMIFERGKFSAEISNLRNSITYRIRAMTDVPYSWRENLVSPNFNVDIIIPPLVNELEIEVSPPVYTRLPKQFLDKNVGDIIAYPGSRIQLRARSNSEILYSEIVFSNGSRIKTKVRENTVNANFVVTEKIRYHVEVFDKDSVKNQEPIEYAITTVDDLSPAIEITEPGDDIEISVDAGLSLTLEGNDDFGFTDLKLHYQILEKMESVRDSTWMQLPIEIPTGSRTFFQQTYLWNIAALSIGFEDMIRYYVTLRDNDIINGPKSARSQLYTIRFPSLDQIFSEFDEKQEETRDQANEVAEESEDLQRELEKISRELKREKQIDWERKREILNAAEKQADIQQKIDEMQKNLENAIETMEKNNLLGPELMDKYQQLQELFREIATPELLKAIENLQHALDKMNTNETQAELQKFKINQEKFRQNLDRVLELFKRIQLEQQMDRLVQMAEKIASEQENITRALDQKKISERIQQQEELTNSVEKNIDNLLNEKLMQQYQNVLDNLHASQEMMQQNKLSEQLEKLRQELNTRGPGEKTKAQSQMLENKFSNLVEQLKQAQKNMRNQDQKRILAQMEKTSENLLRLSEEEETLMSRTQNMSPLSDQFRDLANQQQNLTENMTRVIQDLIEISRQTFFISPEINRALGQANSGMRNSLNELENRNGSRAMRGQEEAMAGLNEAVMQMQSSMQQLAQSGSAFGFEQFIEQMQKMAGQQGQVNQESMNLMQGQGNQSGMSMEQQARYRRLAAEQRAIQKSLENMHGEMGTRSDVLGRLDKLAEEMEEIIQDLESRQIDRTTIQRQQQILSRMLDAQKSVREKEYSRERKSETGKYYARKPPSKDMDTTNKRFRRLTLELLKALQEGYRPDYEKMIESYFQELNRQNLQEQQVKP